MSHLPNLAGPSIQTRSNIHNGCRQPQPLRSAYEEAVGDASRCHSKDAAPFDTEQLLARCMGHMEFVEQLLTSFEQRFPADVREIEQTLEEEDTRRLIRLAHQLKGASANIAAGPLETILADIEQAGREDHLGEIASHLA